MNNSFKELGISAPILQAIDEMGFETPTEVQSRAIPHILKKEDLIVMSKTGSGKTAVFGVSMLQLTDPSDAGPQGLILTPTRELAVQVDNDLKLLSKHLQHKTTVVYGQHSMNTEIKELKNGATIVTGTPGRVFDHIRHGNLQTKHIRFLVLDEADRMLDMGFLEQVVRIIRTLPKDRVTLLFSATIPPEVKRICSEYMKNPGMIEIESQTKTVDTISQVYYRVAHNEKNTQLHRLLLIEQPESCMIFCNTRVATDRVQLFLTRKGISSEALHGDIPQNRRMKTIQQFKEGEFHILVATDVAARGIHVEGLSLVINYDVPAEKDSYVHRIGRTGRAGNEGHSITLVTGEDIMSLYAIEEHIGAMIQEGELPSEDVFNERKAAADGWLQANALKVVPSQQQTKSSQPRHHDSRKDRPARAASDQKSGMAGNSAQASGRSGHAGTERTAGQTQSNRAPYTGDKNRNSRTPSSGEGTRTPYNGGRSGNSRTPQTGERTGSSRAPYTGERTGSSRAPYSGERTGNTRAPYTGERTGNARAPYTGERSGNARAPYTGECTGSSRTPYTGERTNQSGPVSRSTNRIPETDAARAKRNAEAAQRKHTPEAQQQDLQNGQVKDAAPKSSFLQRVIQRIFGK